MDDDEDLRGHHPDDVDYDRDGDVILPPGLSSSDAAEAAQRLLRLATSIAGELKSTADALRDERNNRRILQSENAQLRQLLALRDGDAARALLSELERGSRVVQGAVAALRQAVPDCTPRSDGQGS